jgi:hypothetical protein
MSNKLSPSASADTPDKPTQAIKDSLQDAYHRPKFGEIRSKEELDNA